MVSRTNQHAGRRKDGTPGKGRNPGQQTRSPHGGRAGDGAPASLRLVHPPSRFATPTDPDPRIDDPADPRWVLAVRVAEQLEGSVLGPEKRERLIRLGRVMGLAAFDCNLVIAIVQDQARRGVEPAACAAAGARQLAMVAVPERRNALAGLTGRPTLAVALILMGLILAQVALLSWLF